MVTTSAAAAAAARCPSGSSSFGMSPATRTLELDAIPSCQGVRLAFILLDSIDTILLTERAFFL